MVKLGSLGEDRLSYNLDLDSGEFERVSHPSDEDAYAGARGIGAERWIGLRRRARVLVAKYSWDRALHVQLGQQRFVWPGPYHAQRRYQRLGGPIRAFTVAEDARRCAHFHYVFWGGDGPWPNQLDIFESIAATTASAELLHRAIYYWESEARGEDVHSPEFHERIDAYVRNKTAI